jgi:hypothetical protein
MQCIRSRSAGSVDRQNAPLVSLNSVVGGCRLATDLCLWRSEPDPSWLCRELTEQGSPIQTQRGWHQDEKSLSSEVVPNAHGLRARSADPSDVRTLRSSELGMVISEVVDGAPVPHGMVRSARPLAWRIPCAGTVERRGSRRRSSPGTCAYPPHAVFRGGRAPPTNLLGRPEIATHQVIRVEPPGDLSSDACIQRPDELIQGRRPCWPMWSGIDAAGEADGSRRRPEWVRSVQQH